MTENDKQEFMELWAGCLEVTGNKSTPVALQIAYLALQQYELPAVQLALMQHIQDTESGMFAPKPADVIRHIDGGADDRSLTAWTKVEDAIKAVGSWSPLAFDDARIHAVIAEMGGWMRFCMETYEQLAFTRNEFVKRYRAYIQRKPTNYPAILYGEGSDNQNDTVLIGDKNKATEVMRIGHAGGSTTQITHTKGMSELLRDSVNPAITHIEQ